MITIRDVPEQEYLAIDGAGPAAGPAFTEAVERLYAALAAAGGADVPLEGLWWTPGAGHPFDHDAPEEWRWTLLVPAPDGAVPAAPVRRERLAEGASAEVMHHGPHADEGPTIAALHDWIAAQGLERRGRHHEVYLDDPRTTAPEALRTLLRQPVG
jgi:hypothetical protein